MKLVSSVIHCYFSRYKFDKKALETELKANGTRQKNCVIFKVKRFTLCIQEQFLTFLKLALSRLL